MQTTQSHIEENTDIGLSNDPHTFFVASNDDCMLPHNNVVHVGFIVRHRLPKQNLARCCCQKYKINKIFQLATRLLLSMLERKSNNPYVFTYFIDFIAWARKKIGIPRGRHVAHFYTRNLYFTTPAPTCGLAVKRGSSPHATPSREEKKT